MDARGIQGRKRRGRWMGDTGEKEERRMDGDTRG